MTTEDTYVSYEAFGAVGDGVADDLPAICATHEHANAHDLSVRSRPDATYHLGSRALTAKIAAINATQPLIAIPVQTQLYEAFQHPDVNVVGGISAMPSMHNAQATIFVLTALRLNKWLTVAMGMFGAVIVSASVILGWHYAVDSLAGMALALVIWKLSGWLLAKYAPAKI